MGGFTRLEILWNMLIRFLNMKLLWKGLTEIYRMAYSKCEMNVCGKRRIFPKYLVPSIHPASMYMSLRQHWKHFWFGFVWCIDKGLSIGWTNSVACAFEKHWNEWRSKIPYFVWPTCVRASPHETTRRITVATSLLTQNYCILIGSVYAKQMCETQKTTCCLNPLLESSCFYSTHN